MAFNGIGTFSIEPGKTIAMNGWRFAEGEDLGGQYFSASPTSDNAGVVLVMSEENKTRLPDGSVVYGFSVTDTADATLTRTPTFFDVQGGGFSGGFNGAGDFTIAPGETVVINGWRFGTGEDHGAQYFSANPTSRTGSMLVMSEQNKTRSPNGAVTYGFTIHNADSSNPVSFDVQGGGFVGGFNSVGRFTVNPLDPFFIRGWFEDGEEHGAQYLSANPTSRAGTRLIMSDQNKGHEQDHGVFYGCTITNTDPDFPIYFDLQGGGFI